jgi:hypothetical protein
VTSLYVSERCPLSALFEGLLAESLFVAFVTRLGTPRITLDERQVVCAVHMCISAAVYMCVCV